jgi:tetratricopeptide (TPR) repeat protein
MDRIEKIKAMLIENPTDSFLNHALGLEFVKIGNETEAIERFRQVIEMDSMYVGTYYHLAKALERNNDLNDAIAVYQSGILIAASLNDRHAKNELQMALDEILDDE